MASKIERHVMASVAVIYAARRLVSPFALKLYICRLSFWGLGRLVWVARVFENLEAAGLRNSLRFVFSAVLNTDTLVQVTLLALVVAGASLLLDIIWTAPSRRAFA